MKTFLRFSTTRLVSLQQSGGWFGSAITGLIGLAGLIAIVGVNGNGWGHG